MVCFDLGTCVRHLVAGHRERSAGPTREQSARLKLTFGQPKMLLKVRSVGLRSIPFIRRIHVAAWHRKSQLTHGPFEPLYEAGGSDVQDKLAAVTKAQPKCGAFIASFAAPSAPSCLADALRSTRTLRIQLSRRSSTDCPHQHSTQNRAIFPSSFNLISSRRSSTEQNMNTALDQSGPGGWRHTVA